MFKAHRVRSLSETYNLAKLVYNNTHSGTVIALIGDLGTGKTAFAQGFAKAMGISESVGSPTFKLVSQYEAQNSWLYHIDCYRLKNEQEFIEIGGEEYLTPINGITLIEWADIIEDILPRGCIIINFNRFPENPNFREIKIRN